MAYPTIRAGMRLTASTLAAMLPTEIIKASDEAVTSSTTLQNDNDFAFAVTTGATYQFWGSIFYDGEFNNGNLKATWSLPAGSSITWTMNAPATGGTAAYASDGVTSGNITVGTYGTGGSKTTASIQGTLVTTTTAGTAQFQWAQSVSRPTATTVYARSWINLRRVT